MKIPEKIKIGGFVYDIERPEQPFVSDSEALDGEHDFAEKKIRVAQRGCSEYQDVVFLHEVCHGIIECYAPEYQKEEFVEQFSKGLYQVLIDNPDVFDSAPSGVTINLDNCAAVVEAFGKFARASIRERADLTEDEKNFAYNIVLEYQMRFLRAYGKMEGSNNE